MSSIHPLTLRQNETYSPGGFVPISVAVEAERGISVERSEVIMPATTAMGAPNYTKMMAELSVSDSDAKAQTIVEDIDNAIADYFTSEERDRREAIMKPDFAQLEGLEKKANALVSAFQKLSPAACTAFDVFKRKGTRITKFNKYSRLLDSASLIRDDVTHFIKDLGPAPKGAPGKANLWKLIEDLVLIWEATTGKALAMSSKHGSAMAFCQVVCENDPRLTGLEKEVLPGLKKLQEKRRNAEERKRIRRRK